MVFRPHWDGSMVHSPANESFCDRWDGLRIRHFAVLDIELVGLNPIWRLGQRPEMDRRAIRSLTMIALDGMLIQV